jgi:hypothetical protein
MVSMGLWVMRFCRVGHVLTQFDLNFAGKGRQNTHPIVLSKYKVEASVK